jgi:hypothetical protein
MRDPPDSAVFEVDICREARPSDYRAEVHLVPKVLDLTPRPDEEASAGHFVIEGFAEHFVKTLIRALAAWPT